MVLRLILAGTFCHIFCLALPSWAFSQTRGLEECKLDNTMAKVVMTHRQNGIWDINEMMERLGGEPGLREMIIDAYGHSRMQTSEARQFTIDEFANAWTVRCFSQGSVLPGGDG